MSAFFIASSGGSATLSIARYFDGLSPRIRCYHGAELHDGEEHVRSPEGERGLARKQLAMSRDGMTVGSVHAMHNAWARDAMVEGGGRTAVIFRHPVKRAISLFRTPGLWEKSGTGQVVLRRPITTAHGRTIQTLIGHIVGLQPDAGDDRSAFGAHYNFASLLVDIIAVDMRNVRGFPDTERFRFEDLTQEPDALGTLARTVLGNAFEADIARSAGLPHEHDREARVPTDQIVALLEAKVPNFISDLLHVLDPEIEKASKTRPSKVYRDLGYAFFEF